MPQASRLLGSKPLIHVAHFPGKCTRPVPLLTYHSVNRHLIGWMRLAALRNRSVLREPHHPRPSSSLQTRREITRQTADVVAGGKRKMFVCLAHPPTKVDSSSESRMPHIVGNPSDHRRSLQHNHTMAFARLVCVRGR
jgi:hypothetical protein